MAADYTETISLGVQGAPVIRVPDLLDLAGFGVVSVQPPTMSSTITAGVFKSVDYKGGGGGGSTRPASGFLYPRGQG